MTATGIQSLDHSIDQLLNLPPGGAAVLSVYLGMPTDPVELRGLPARLSEILGTAERTITETGRAERRMTRKDVTAVRDVATTNARQWLGHGVAIFAAHSRGLWEELVLPYPVRDRAVIDTRPYLRPLLSMLQRRPPHYTVVVDRRHAWLFRFTIGGIETLGRQDGPVVRSASYAGWYGLDEHHARERAAQLTKHHYRDTVRALGRLLDGDQRGLLVIGGHGEGHADFLSLLPHQLRRRLAGTFTVDPHSMTPASVRDHSRAVVEQWEGERERRLIDDIAHRDSGVITGLPNCVAAANQSAVRLLLVPDEVAVPGFACDACGMLSVEPTACAGCGRPIGPVPDVIERMVHAVRGSGGQVELFRSADAPDGPTVAAELRFPLSVG